MPRSHYRRGYEVEVIGAKVLSAPNARYLRLERQRGAVKAAVTVRPATG